MTKVVEKNCADKAFWGAVQAADSSGCFSACSPGLNTTDPCHIRCLYSTILGPDAGSPGGKVSGMPLNDLIAAWDAPFASDDPSKGGCPSLPVV